MLPKMNHPTQKVKQPSTGKTVRIRPFTVKEEKILLMAQMSDELDGFYDAVKQVINNCVIDDIDVETLPNFDLEYLFLKLRAFSVNNIIELTFFDPDDKKDYKTGLNLDDVEVYTDPAHKPKIQLTPEVGVVMKYPNGTAMMEIMKVMTTDGENGANTIDALFDLYAKSMAKVWDEEGVYEAGKDFDTKEAVEFLESLSPDALQKIQEFFATQPILKHDVSYKRDNGEKRVITLSGLADFFQ